MMSIGTFNEQDRQTLEPHTSSLKKRIQVLEEIKDIKKLKTSVFLGPLYPNMTWKKTKELLDRLLDIKISSILIDNFHLKPGLQEQINSILPKDESLTSGFNENVFNSSNWFQRISNDIKQYVEKHSTDIKVKDAF